MVTLSTIDALLILLYFLVILFVGYRSARRTSPEEEDFLLAGRSLTLPVFVMTLVSTWYGGILGIGEFTYRYGISNWLVLGVPYYLFAAIFAVFLAKKVRATNLFSIPDKLQLAYDKRTAVLGAILTFLLMTPAPYVLMLSLLLHILFGWSLTVGMAVTAVVAFSYLYLGGFRSDVATDLVEFVLMFIGFAVIIPFTVSRFGGIEFLTEYLPPVHLEWQGGHSVQFIVAWFFIGLWTLVDPAFHQRCYAAKDGTTAQRGILVSIAFWLVFDFMTVTVGLYARATMPSLEEPMMSYPLFAERILPPVAKGVFFIGMLATVMSTLNTLALVSAQTLGRDIFLRVQLSEFNKQTSPHLATRSTRVGLIVSFLLSMALAFAVPSVIQLWYTIGTVAIPGLLIPLMASYFGPLNIPAKYAFRSMLFGWLTSLGWLIAGHLAYDGSYPLGLEPMIPGLLVSLVLWSIGKLGMLRR